MIINTMTTNIPKSSETLTPEQKTELSALKEAFTSSLLAIMDANKTDNANLDLLQLWPETNNLPELYNQLSDMKECLDSFRPFNTSMLQNMMGVLDIRYTYESNRIEGNTLTLGETAMVIEKGITIGGKTVAEHLEAINHQEAIHYIRDLAKQELELSERHVKLIHTLVLKGIRDRDAGVYRNQPVFIVNYQGKEHQFPQAYLVPKLMEDFFVFFNENKDKMHPVEMSAHLHQKLVNIHPFIDGNGRTSRLLMNLYLFQKGYPVTILESEQNKREEYYKILGEYQSVFEGDSKPFELFVAKKAKESLIEHLNFFVQDYSDAGKEKGYAFFKKIQPLIEAQNKK